MSARAHEANGHEPKATKAEHDSLRTYVEREFAEVKGHLAFIGDQVKLIGQAMELLLKANGIDQADDRD